MKTFKDFRVAPDGDILDQIQELLRPHEPGLGPHLPAVLFYQAELTRRAVARLLESSTRLERLTKVLIAVTVVLLVVALPGALDLILRFYSW
jgi:hypothetical protein